MSDSTPNKVPKVCAVVPVNPIRIVVFEEKHGSRHFTFTKDEELGLIAAYIVRERNDEGWYEDETKRPLLLKKALEGYNEAALKFLQTRSGYEYERFEIIEPETVEGLNI